MRLFAYPAALFLAFILYCAAPKFADGLARALQKLYTLFQRLDARAPRKLAFPAFLLALMLVPFLLALLHPAVEAVLMRSRSSAFPASRKAARSSASWIPARIPAISPRMNPSSARPAPRSPRPSSRMSACRSC